MELRDYQHEAIAASRGLWAKGHRYPLVVLPTGTGKTCTASSQVDRAAQAGHRVLWLAHREELIFQPLRTLQALAPKSAKNAGIVKAERNDVTSQIVYASCDTLRNSDRLAEYLSHGCPTLVVLDEAHHSVSPTYLRIKEAIEEAGSPYWLGLTATPERTDRKDLAKSWGWEIAYFYSLTRAMDDGFLAPVRCEVERLPNLDLSSVGGKYDYDDEELGEALLLANVVEHTYDALMTHGPDRHPLIFCASVKQAQETSDYLNSRGMVSRWISGTTPTADRQRILRAFQSGQIQALANCAVLTEGTDLPRCDCVVMARPTRSKPLYVQCIGRGLRLFPGKDDCLLLDIAGASDEHDLIQAPVLLGEMQTEDAKTRGLTPSDKQKRSALAGLFGDRKERKALSATWVRVRGLDREVWTVDCGDEGKILVVASDRVEGDYDPYWVPKQARKPHALAEVPVPLELAYGLGNDVVRRARNLNYPKAQWRMRKASDKQKEFATRLGVMVPSDATRGDIAELITHELASQTAVKLGLARKA